MKALGSNNPLGFVGVGAMGSRIVHRLLASGYKVTVYDRDRKNANAMVADGAAVSDSLAELAAHNNVILSCLTNDDAVREVYLAQDGILAHAAQGTIIVEMSTIRPQTSREVARAGADRGIHVLDVAISGSTPAVEQGTVTLLGGGEPEIFSAVTPILETVARQYFYLGPAGCGTATKLVVNTLLGVGMQAIAEACVLGEKQGLDREKLLTVLSKTAVVAPAHAGKLLRAVHDDYDPQFPVRLMNKDFRLILETAGNLNVALPTAEAAFQINSEAFVHWPEKDFSIVIREMESQVPRTGAGQAVGQEV